MNNVTIFQFGIDDLREVRLNGEPWFVLADICKVLKLSDVGRVADRLDDDELTRKKVVSGGQEREMILVNESGLYAAVLRSNKPQAKKFRKWVTSEVLPSIRKTGSYTLDPETRLKYITKANKYQLPYVLQELGINPALSILSKTAAAPSNEEYAPAIARFITETLEPADNAIPLKTAFEYYVTWCRTSKLTPIGKKRFTQELKHCGLEIKPIGANIHSIMRRKFR